MNKKISFIILFSVVISIFSYVNVFALKIGDEIGNVLNTDIKTYINGNRIPSYNINNKSVVFIKDLANYGFDTVFSEQAKTITITYNPNKKVTAIKRGLFDESIFEKSTEQVGTVAFKYKYTDVKAIVNCRSVECFNVKGYNVIFFSELGDYGTFSWDDERRISKFKAYNPLIESQIEENITRACLKNKNDSAICTK